MPRKTASGSALGARQALLESLTSNLHDTILVIDILGRIKEAFGGYRRATGWTRQEIIGRSAFDFVHPDDRGGAIERLFLMLRDPTRSGRFQFIVRLGRADGSYLSAEIMASFHVFDPAIGGIVVSARDITARLETERQFLEQQALLNCTADSVDATLLLLSPHGRIRYVNRPLAGIERDALVGRDLQELLPVESRERVTAALAAVRPGGDPAVVRLRLESAGPGAGACEARVSPVVVDRRLDALALMLVDVSDRSRLERAVFEATQREQNRIGSDIHDSLGQSLTGAMLVARSIATSLANGNPGAPGAPGTAGTAAAAEELVGMLSDAVKDVRRIARGLAPLIFDRVGLQGAIDEVLRRMTAVGAVRAEFDCDAGAACAVRPQVAEHLFRIAQEAITNAVRHARPSVLRVELHRDGDAIVLRVADDGVGLPQPLEARPGTGLATMRFRADLIGAALALLPARPQGTVVECRVRADGEAPAAA
jgi:PAS domain S-box-containing protein